MKTKRGNLIKLLLAVFAISSIYLLMTASTDASTTAEWHLDYIMLDGTRYDVQHNGKELFMDYRERLRSLREDRDLTQSEIGKLLNKSQQGYNHIEAGRAELKIEDLVTLCRFYNLSADYLIGLVDTPSSFHNNHNK